jgi:outer membrane protein assembly factor BamB
LFDLAATPQIVTFTQKYFVGVSLESGKLQWRHRLPCGARQPRVGHQQCVRTDEVSTHMSDAVVIDGVLFGLSRLNSGQYFALDLDSGKVLWSGSKRSCATRWPGVIRGHNRCSRGIEFW